MSSSRQQDLAIRGRDTAPSGSDQRSGSRKSNTSRSRPVVPVPAKENKRTNLGQRLLAFTCDGTGQMGDSKAHNARFKSNPYKTHEMLENATHEFLKVLSFYHRGPAPYLQSDVKKEQEWSKWAAAFGSDVGDCIMDGYRTLAENYKPNDEVLLIGFSRGGQVVRGVASMMHAARGLIQFDPDATEDARKLLVKDLYDLWEKFDGKHITFTKDQQKKFSIRPGSEKVHKMQLYDPVSAVRNPFHPEFAGSIKPTTQKLKFLDSDLDSNILDVDVMVAIHERRELFLPVIPVRAANSHTKVLIVYFAGVHINIGGGGGGEGLERFPLAHAINQLFLWGNLDFSKSGFAAQKKDIEDMNFDYEDSKWIPQTHLGAKRRLPALQSWVNGKTIEEGVVKTTSQIKIRVHISVLGIIMWDELSNMRWPTSTYTVEPEIDPGTRLADIFARVMTTFKRTIKLKTNDGRFEVDLRISTFTKTELLFLRWVFYALPQKASQIPADNKKTRALFELLEELAKWVTP